MNHVHRHDVPEKLIKMALNESLKPRLLAVSWFSTKFWNYEIFQGSVHDILHIFVMKKTVNY